MKKILVPTDFSSNATHALNVALKIANKLNAKIELLHVNVMLTFETAFPEYPTATTLQDEDYHAEAQEKLERTVDQLMLQDGNVLVEIDTKIKSGFLHPTIENIATDDDCDLIVMGTKGTSMNNHFLLGTNTEKIIRHAKCPVLAVPESSGAFFPDCVIFPTTLIPEQLPTFKVLAEWQQKFMFEVKVLYMKNPAGFKSNEEIESALAHLCNQSGLKYSHLFTAPITLDEEEVIRDFANAEGADLIVMATHQRKGISHLMFGSLTENTVNHSRIPVLCVPIK
jgi:nucleotide-binding universal stress UspA family protein